MKICLLMMSFLFVSCSTSTTMPYTTAEKNVWFLETHSDKNFPIYCMANEKEKTAEPTCFKARKIGF
jgi:hypothetical protein